MSVPLTAILTCRNAEATVGKCLDHLLWHGAKAIVIDNGSTDSTREIIQAAGEGVELRTDPYNAAFDLTRQLRIKREIIENVTDGWIIHADSDEFLDTPEGTPLSEHLALWQGSDVIAMPCAEIMFLPASDTERHEPETFQETMHACIRIADRDPKERVFRARAPLDRWMATGGHTVTRATDPAPPISLTLRHYFGLSLDQIRAEYLGRIYAPGDLGKLWHGDRLGVARTVVPPADGILLNPEDLADKPVHRTAPVFEPHRTDTPPSENTAANLELITISPETRAQITTMIEDAFPGIVLGETSATARGRRPRLLVTEHPALDRPENATLVGHAEHWLRTVAGARQSGLAEFGPYAELRLEDVEDLPGLVMHTVRRLLSGGAIPPLLTETEPLHTNPAYAGRLRTITRPLAADLGYG